VNTKVKAKALQTLDNMAEIVRNERLIKGAYIHPAVDLEFSDAVCGGHKACLIGSAWLAYGIKMRGGDLPGSHPTARPSFLRNRPALRVVYDALNDAAERKVRKNNSLREAFIDEYEIGRSYHSIDEVIEDEQNRGLAEALFEGGLVDSRSDLLRLVRSARKQIEAA
jgi:hypothetical protein